MTEPTVQIVLVGGPLDGETHAIPEAEARSGIARRYVPPVRLDLVALYVTPEEALTKLPTRLEYRPMTVDFAGWQVPSITDDGVRRYKFAGEW